ncbi:MAG: hypothetical protein SGJ20_11010 [Planctomycetota bacterium]|nr:hypothetical protein [Planctomycetota bacterium]
MSRRRGMQNSSLELLLDTICNTFGGVLFLAILVCVLLQMSSPRASPLAEKPAPVSDMAELHSRLQGLLAEIATLETAVTQQQAFSQQFAKSTPNAAATAQQLQQSQHDTLIRQRLEMVAETQQRQIHALEIEKELKELEEKQATAKEGLKERKTELATASEAGAALATAAEKLLDAIAAATARTAPLPRQRTTFKTEVGLVIRYNRLYLWHKYDGNNTREGLNTDEFVVVEDRGDAAITLPKPYAGVPIDPKEIPAMTARLRQFDRGDHYFAVVIWPDSYETFQTLKNTLVGLGFEYRLMPMTEGEPIADRGGSGGKVQ